jgi:hypothetical protein
MIDMEKTKKEQWKPYCFGEYQGVGDDSCFECKLKIQCDARSKERIKAKKESPEEQESELNRLKEENEAFKSRLGTKVLNCLDDTKKSLDLHLKLNQAESDIRTLRAQAGKEWRKGYNFAIEEQKKDLLRRSNHLLGCDLESYAQVLRFRSQIKEADELDEIASRIK